MKDFDCTISTMHIVRNGTSARLGKKEDCNTIGIIRADVSTHVDRGFQHIRARWLLPQDAKHHSTGEPSKPTRQEVISRTKTITNVHDTNSDHDHVNLEAL